MRANLKNETMNQSLRYTRYTAVRHEHHPRKVENVIPSVDDTIAVVNRLKNSMCHKHLGITIPCSGHNALLVLRERDAVDCLRMSHCRHDLLALEILNLSVTPSRTKQELAVRREERGGDDLMVGPSEDCSSECLDHGVGRGVPDFYRLVRPCRRKPRPVRAKLNRPDLISVVGETGKLFRDPASIHHLTRRPIFP